MTNKAGVQRQIDYKVMRTLIGVIAIGLGPVVMLLSGNASRLTSISVTYWTDAQDVFVGSLLVVGFFLAAYNGTGGGRDLTYWVSKFACVFAIGVGLFPTAGFPESGPPSWWALAIARSIWTEPEAVHVACAVLMFACLIALLAGFAANARAKGADARANTYTAINFLMIGGMMVIGAVGALLEWERTVLFVEIWGLTFFGLGWLRAGTYRSS
ncbi:MAG: hypothetical protein AAF458_10800 [Pseudomonadota bacterium]